MIVDLKELTKALNKFVYGDAPKNTKNYIKQSAHEKEKVKVEPQQRDISEKRDYSSEFLKRFRSLTYSHGTWEVWCDFVTMTACAISNSIDKTYFDAREKMYLTAVQKYKNEEERMIFPDLFALTVLALDENPEQDFLGRMYMDLGLGNRANGQFFTPYCICELMSDITLGAGNASERIKQQGYITLYDPCCGAGATLIAGVASVKRQLLKEHINFQNHLLIAAQDIDFVSSMMCYIQLSLLGVAAYVKVGNTLTDPMRAGDSTESYWFTPMYFSDIWTCRRLIERFDDILTGGK